MSRDEGILNKAVLWGFEGGSDEPSAVPLITWVPTHEVNGFDAVFNKLKMHNRYWELDKCLPSGTVIYREFDPNGQTT